MTRRRAPATSTRAATTSTRAAKASTRAVKASTRAVKTTARATKTTARVATTTARATKTTARAVKTTARAAKTTTRAANTGARPPDDRAPSASSATAPSVPPAAALATFGARVTDCCRCDRLVRWCTTVARDKRAAYADDTYWGRPIAGFGDPAARLIVCGLAPGAHGANRTGRVFTGDRSGDWLYRALHRAGFANQPTSTRADDGLRLADCWVTLVVRCAPPNNKPLPTERDTCLPFLVDELGLLARARVVVCLGAFAWDGVLRALAARGHTPADRPRFAHGAETTVGNYVLLGSYHPSQQNTFTGRLTEPMLDAVFTRARALVA